MSTREIIPLLVITELSGLMMSLEITEGLYKGSIAVSTSVWQLHFAEGADGKPHHHCGGQAGLIESSLSHFWRAVGDERRQGLGAHHGAHRCAGC